MTPNITFGSLQRHRRPPAWHGTSSDGARLGCRDRCVPSAVLAHHYLMCPNWRRDSHPARVLAGEVPAADVRLAPGRVSVAGLRNAGRRLSDLLRDRRCN